MKSSRAPSPDLEELYRQVARIRYFETALRELWQDGLISGEMHMGTGEEAVIAGVVSHLEDGDALAVDHRSTPPLAVRGVSLKSMVLELLGSQKGLCRAMGGHMHLFSKEHLAASSGIVGSSAALGAGFALAAQHLRPGKIAVAFFGEGAMNQGMLLETLNLAVAWKLPLVLVCKDNGYAITTRSRSVSGGSLVKRARSFGMPAECVDGLRVDRVWGAAEAAVRRARGGRGPTFIHARCLHLDGHFLGDPILRVYKEPVKQLSQISGPLAAATVKSPGARLVHRLCSLMGIGRSLLGVGCGSYLPFMDPLDTSGKLIDPQARAAIDEEAKAETEAAIREALEEAGVSP
jgi:pyruvate dehydrogenase E1 component alpha subunit